MRKVFLDTETTGLAPGQIAQLAFISEDDNGNIACGNYFFEVDYMSTDAEIVTGRGIEDYKELSHGQRFKDRADELYEIFSNSTLIAHNLRFDENFISTEFWRLNKIFKPSDRFDTMEYFRDICKLPGGKWGQQYKPPKLVELVDYLTIDKEMVEKYCEQLFKLQTGGFHDAMYDTTSMFVAFQVYREILRQDGKREWREAFCKEV